MQAIERVLQERQRFVKSKLAAEGVPPTPPQLVAFLRGLVDMIRPHTGRIPPPAAELLRECFMMVSWDVVTNSPVAGSSPCTAGQLVNFLETTSKRLRMGVVTAGWRDQPPKSGKSPSTDAADPSPAAATPEPAPEPAVASAVPSAATGDNNHDASKASSGTEASVDAHTAAAAPAADEAGEEDQKPSTSTERSRPPQDEDLFYMDEAEAIRQIQKEIEEQIERNHYKALGI